MRSWTAGGPATMSPDVEPGPLVALPVGDHAAGLADEQPAGGDVPGAEGLLEVAVEHAGGGPGQVQAGGTGPPEVLECRARPARTPAGTRRGARAWRGTGSRSREIALASGRSLTRDAARRCGTRRRRGAPSRVSPSIGAWTTPTTGPPSTTSPIDTPTDGEPVHEVGGAVERIDEPPDVGALTAALLTEERDLRRRPCERVADRRARSRCRCRSPVARPLLADVAAARRSRRARSQRLRRPRRRPRR